MKEINDEIKIEEPIIYLPSITKENIYIHPKLIKKLKKNGFKKNN